MQAKTRKVIQLLLALLLLAAAVRLVIVIRSRGGEAPTARRGERGVDLGLDADAYVVPKRLRAYDLESTRQLIGRPVWAREGHRYTYYPYNDATRRADFDQEAGMLAPIERIEIKDVVLQRTPGVTKQQQVLAVFRKDGKSYAVPVGTARAGDYRIYADEVFFIHDPRQLYKHWSADVWQAIDNHEVRQGMNEMQASFAVGMGTPQASADDAVKTVVYPNGGKQLIVTYRRGKAAEISGPQ